MHFEASSLAVAIADESLLLFTSSTASCYCTTLYNYCTTLFRTQTQTHTYFSVGAQCTRGRSNPTTPTVCHGIYPLSASLSVFVALASLWCLLILSFSHSFFIFFSFSNTCAFLLMCKCAHLQRALLIVKLALYFFSILSCLCSRLYSSHFDLSID